MSRIRAVCGLAIAQLRHDRTRTVLAVLGVTLAVLATTTLASVGYGVVETGQEKFDSAGRDLWVTGGPVQFAPGTVGGLKNTVVNAHQLAEDIERREAVQTAVPMAFQTVYVGTNKSHFETLIGTGAPARGGSVNIVKGRHFNRTDVHYAGGSYDGPMTHEVIIDSRTASLFNVTVGDTLYIGGTLASARQHEFTIVGISPTFSRFLGAPTVVLHLSELQEITGTTGSDRATLITVSLKEGANPEQVAAAIERDHPGYQVRTNKEQLQATLERQAVVLASGASLVALAVIAGIALTVNLLLSFVHQQRQELAALKALGSSTGTLAGVVFIQALLLGTAGGGLGVALTFPAVAVLNDLAARLVGFENLVRTQQSILLIGFAIAISMSILGALAAGLRIARLSPLAQLDK